MRKNGPATVTMEMNDNKFLDIMMDLMESGEYQILKGRIADSISKYASRVQKQ